MAIGMDRHRAKINVVVRPGAIQIAPERLEVTAGTLVEWHFESRVPTEGVDVMVYFHKASPFPWREEKRHLRVDAPSSVIAAAADDPGEYKYGVSAHGASTLQLLGDEDPWLIVRSV